MCIFPQGVRVTKSVCMSLPPPGWRFKQLEDHGESALAGDMMVVLPSEEAGLASFCFRVQLSLATRTLSMIFDRHISIFKYRCVRGVPQSHSCAARKNWLLKISRLVIIHIPPATYDTWVIPLHR